MSNSVNANGNPTQRKTLAAQLDRLDGIIDALDQALPEAVADAVNQAVSAAVRQAVEVVLLEVLSRPELLRALAPPAPAARGRRRPAGRCAGSGPSRLRRCWGWLGGKLAGACARIGQVVGLATRRSLAVVGLATRGSLRVAGQVARRSLDVAGTLYRGTTNVLRLGWGVLLVLAGWLRQRPWTVLLSLVVGVAVGLGAYLAGPVVSSAALGLTGAMASLVGSALAPLFRLLAGWRGPHSGA